MTTASITSLNETHKELVHKLAEREQHLKEHDQQTETLFEDIRQLIEQPEKQRKACPACPVECEAYSTGVKSGDHFSGGSLW